MTKRERDAERQFRKDVKALLTGNLWQGEAIIRLLTDIKEGIKNLATAEQVAALKDAIDSVETTLSDEIDEVIAAIEAAGTGGHDPALDEQIARLTTLKDKIENVIAAAPTPDPEA